MTARKEGIKEGLPPWIKQAITIGTVVVAISIAAMRGESRAKDIEHQMHAIAAKVEVTADHDMRLTVIESDLKHHFADPSIHHGKLKKLEEQIAKMNAILIQLELIHHRLDQLEKKIP